MGFYLLAYYGTGQPVPPEQRNANREAWRKWNQALGEVYGIRTAPGGVTVTGQGAAPYNGQLRGVSIIQTDSLQAAAEIARDAPNIALGGYVEVLSEFEV